MTTARIGMTERILSFLHGRDEPASSHMLVERFLKAGVDSEELATRLLRPLLEAGGARYSDGRGWIAPDVVPDGPRGQRFVAAAIDRATGRVILSQGEAPAVTDTIVLLEPRVDRARLLAWLRAEGLEPPVILSLRSALRGVARIRRGAGLGEICETLGILWLERDDAEGAVVAMAACLAEAAMTRERRKHEEDAPADETVLPGCIRREDLATLPETPGVYRFYDAEGRLLYVGKAVNLRRRVSSYFTPGASRKPRRFYSRIHRMEHEVAGSELEALLREALLIKRRAPEGNVQIEVRERGFRFAAARSVAILLPGHGKERVTAIIVRDGRCLGQVRVGPRGGGLPAARRLLGKAICPRRVSPRSLPLDRDSEILGSWLARHGDSVSRLDLDSFTKVGDAARALREAVKSVLSEPGAVLFRSR